MTLYRVPFIVEDELEQLMKENMQYEFRVGYVYNADAEALAEDPNLAIDGTYTLYGILDEENSPTALPRRDVWNVNEFVNTKLCLLRSLVNVYSGSATGYYIDKPLTYKDTPTLSLLSLPTGTYVMAFVVTDVFGNMQRSVPFEIQWDTKKSTADYNLLE